jgi:hypothetical protein
MLKVVEYNITSNFLIMKTNKITPMIIAIFLIALTISCSTDNSTLTDVASIGNVELKAKATITNTAPKNSASAKGLLNNLNITSLKINIKNIEFGINENEGDHNNSNDSIYHDLKLEGPFLLDLASTNTSIDIANVEVPNNVYDKVQFELNKSRNLNSAMFGKSIEIKGDINGTPFVFWTDAEEEMEVNFSAANTNIIVNGTTTITTINFNLNTIFGTASTIDFSLAVDGNADGVIEISPNNNDGNADLADLIKNLFKEGTDLEND